MADRGNAASLSLSHPHSSSSEDDASGHRLTPLALPPPAAATPEKTTVASEFGSPTPSRKKPRGRPPGSKNKPKPPVVITAAPDSSGSSSSSSAMRPVILEISAGSDVVDALTSFALRRRMGLAVLNAFGSVSDVTLRHPLPHAPPLSLRGPFNLLSLSGSVLAGGCINGKNDNNESKNDWPAKQLCRQEGSSHFGITLAGSQGQLFGGVVGGKVVAATSVVVAAATFVSPSFHRFPSEGDEEGDDHRETKPCIGGGGGGGGSEPPSCPSSAALAGGLYCGGGGLSGQAMSPEVMPWGGAANSASRPPY